MAAVSMDFSNFYRGILSLPISFVQSGVDCLCNLITNVANIASNCCANEPQPSCPSHLRATAANTPTTLPEADRAWQQREAARRGHTSSVAQTSTTRNVAANPFF